MGAVEIPKAEGKSRLTIALLPRKGKAAPGKYEFNSLSYHMKEAGKIMDVSNQTIMPHLNSSNSTKNTLS